MSDVYLRRQYGGDNLALYVKAKYGDDDYAIPSQGECVAPAKTTRVTAAT